MPVTLTAKANCACEAIYRHRNKLTLGHPDNPDGEADFTEALEAARHAQFSNETTEVGSLVIEPHHDEYCPIAVSDGDGFTQRTNFFELRALKSLF